MESKNWFSLENTKALVCQSTSSNLHYSWLILMPEGNENYQIRVLDNDYRNMEVKIIDTSSEVIAFYFPKGIDSGADIENSYRAFLSSKDLYYKLNVMRNFDGNYGEYGDFSIYRPNGGASVIRTTGSSLYGNIKESQLLMICESENSPKMIEKANAAYHKVQKHLNNEYKMLKSDYEKEKSNML